MTEEQILEMWKKEISESFLPKKNKPNGIGEIEGFKQLIAGIPFKDAKISTTKEVDTKVRRESKQYPCITMYVGKHSEVDGNTKVVYIDFEDKIIMEKENAYFADWYMEQKTEDGIYDITIKINSPGELGTAIVKFKPNAIYESAYPNIPVEEVKSGLLDRKEGFITPNVTISTKSIPVRDEDIPRLINKLAKEGLKEIYETGSISLPEESMAAEEPAVQIIGQDEPVIESQPEEKAIELDQMGIIYDALKTLQEHAAYLLSQEQLELIARLDAVKKINEEFGQGPIGVEDSAKSK